MILVRPALTSLAACGFGSAGRGILGGPGYPMRAQFCAHAVSTSRADRIAKAITCASIRHGVTARQSKTVDVPRLSMLNSLAFAADCFRIVSYRFSAVVLH
jgi:hypothetical protein